MLLWFQNSVDSVHHIHLAEISERKFDFSRPAINNIYIWTMEIQETEALKPDETVATWW